MKIKWYLAALVGLFVLGNIVAADPDNSAFRVMLYTLGFALTSFIIYYYLGHFFGWRGKSDDDDDQATARSEKQENTPNPHQEISRQLIDRTRSHIHTYTPANVHTEITVKIRRAASGDVPLMLAFGRGFLFGDAYLRRDIKIAMEWLAHAARHDDKDAIFLLDWAVQEEKKGKVPEMPNKPPSYISTVAPSSPTAQIEDMIGLENVKKQIKALLNRQSLEALRKKSGLPSESDINLHLVFTGNPGTGKTMVAQRLGAILADAGLLTTGHLVEASGVDLVDRYVGGTTPKVEAAVAKALGGILFIDEAYALISHVGSRGPESSAAMEGITALLMQMNKHKGRFMVIVAGYPEEMNGFLNFNPGLKSRFRETLHFDNFSTEELVQIFLKIAKDRHYILAEGSQTVLEKIMRAAPGKYAKSFGNARFVGNLFEETLERVANRVAKKKDVTREDLMTITPFDINDAAEDFMRQNKR